MRLQHRYYVPMALVSGFVVPTLLASCWGDALGGFLFVGHVSKLLTWHTTFCINSLAHWTGSQDYSLEFTARGNLLLALLTNGEGKRHGTAELWCLCVFRAPQLSPRVSKRLPERHPLVRLRPDKVAHQARLPRRPCALPVRDARGGHQKGADHHGRAEDCGGKTRPALGARP